MGSNKGRAVAVLSLLLIAPLSAELLIGYDDLIGQPVAIVISLVFFVPLYGAPALLVREIVRRTGRGWPTVLGLGFAFGLVQAGLIDHGLFNPDYRGIPYWQALRTQTFIDELTTSGHMVMNFVVGHMLRTVAVPIALTEALFPRLRDKPWLTRRGIAGTVLTWLAGAAVVGWGSISNEQFVPTSGQLVGTAAMIIAVIVLSLLPFGRGETVPARLTYVPTPKVVGVIAVAAIVIHQSVPPTWPGLIVDWACLLGLALAVLFWSRSQGWMQQHLLALVAGCLLGHAAISFVTQPLGIPTLATKLAVNAALAALALGLLAVAARKAGNTQWLYAPSVAASVVAIALAAAPCSVLASTMLQHTGYTADCTPHSQPRAGTPTT